MKVRRQLTARICQGDIFRDVEYIEYASEKAGVIEVSKIVFPLIIVLTQDCDLEQDYKFRWSDKRKTVKTQDKWLISVLVAPIYNAEHLFLGEHLLDLNMRMEPINRKRSPGTMLMNNERPRYHYLDFPKSIPLVPSIIDFKHYFSVNVQYLKSIKKTNFVCTISDLYREDISQRFASFLARIGLPDKD